MGSTFVADLGRAARAAPRIVIAIPRSRLARRLIVALALLLICAVPSYMLWFRHSSLVAADEVDVTGVSFARAEITAALTDTGEGMSTVAPDVGALEDAVRGYPTVASISVDADFPDRLAIVVNERAPVASVGAGKGVPVAGDGTVLSGVEVGDLELPAIESRSVPASGRLEGVGLAQAEVLGPAPDPMRDAIDGIGVDREHGVEVMLAGGIELRFGDSRNAAAKWAAAAAILADPKLAQLSYIDLRLPGRPAVGGASASALQSEVEEETVAPIPAPAAPAPATHPPATTADLAAGASEVADPAAVDTAAAAPPASVPAAADPSPATGVAGSTAAP
jgi:cell division septal protein FtsQ